MNGLTECISGNVKAPIRDVRNLANSLHSLIRHHCEHSEINRFCEAGLFLPLNIQYRCEDLIVRCALISLVEIHEVKCFSQWMKMKRLCFQLIKCSDSKIM